MQTPLTLCTNIEGVFAGGDCVTGPSTIMEAVASGRLAADMIDKYLRGEELKREHTLTRPTHYLPPLQVEQEYRRVRIPSIPWEERIKSFSEIGQCISEEDAVREANRCLRCDLQTEDGKNFLKVSTKC